MIRFWEGVTAPLLQALQPRSILQIGDKDGVAALKLIEAACQIGATVHVVALKPAIDVEAARRQAGDLLVVHRTRGLDAVPLLPSSDLVLIDDDPNWYTVHGLLTAIELQAERSRGPFPVVAVTNVGWPYARRDAYDEPSAIPAAHRQGYEQAGVVPGRSTASGQSGLFSDRFHATEDNQAQSGVLTALEDFLAKRPGRFMFHTLPIFHGLALVLPTGGTAEQKLEGLMVSLGLGRSAIALVSALEAARIALEIGNRTLQDELVRANYRNDLLQVTVRDMQQSNPAPDEPSALTLAHALWRRVRAAVASRMRGLIGTDAAPVTIAADSDLDRVRSCAIFDGAWYVARYADLGIDAADPVQHYLTHGRALGLDPGPEFSTQYYLATYSDVAAAGIDPLVHYLSSGAAEGRDPSPSFRTRYYLEAYPDVADAGYNPLEHYVRFGRAEGRRTAAD
jgi:hypothetical protein